MQETQETVTKQTDNLNMQPEEMAKMMAAFLESQGYTVTKTEPEGADAKTEPDPGKMEVKDAPVLEEKPDLQDDGGQYIVPDPDIAPVGLLAGEGKKLSKRQYKKMVKKEEKAARSMKPRAAEDSRSLKTDALDPQKMDVTVTEPLDSAAQDEPVSEDGITEPLSDTNITEPLSDSYVTEPLDASPAAEDRSPAAEQKVQKKRDIKKAARLTQKEAMRDYKESSLKELYNEHDTIDKVKKSVIVKQRLKRTADMILGSIDTGEEEIDFPYPPLTMASTLMPVSNIKDGIIETTFGSYAHIVEVKPNRPYKDALTSFEAVAKVFPKNVQFKVFTRDAYVKPITDRFEEHIHTETSDRAKEIGTEHIKMITEEAKSAAVSKRYFMIVSYQPTSKTFKNFHSAGLYFNEVLPKLFTEIVNSGLSILTDRYDSNAQAQIIYDVANRNRSHYLNFAENISLVEGEYQRKYGDAEHIPVSEFLTPPEIDTTLPDCVYMDGLYYSYLMFRPEGIPQKLTREWILYYANIERNCDVDIFFDKEDRDHAVLKSRISGTVNTGIAERAAKRNKENDAAASMVSSSRFIHDSLKDRDDQELFYATVLITLSAESRKAVLALRDSVIRESNRVRKSLFLLPKKQYLACRASLPVYAAPKKFLQLGRRNMISSNLPFVNPMECTEKIERDSLFCGYVLTPDVIKDLYDDREDRVSCYLTQYLYSYNPWDTKTCANANLSIFGGSGKGKSYTLHNLCTQCRLKHIPVYVMIPEKGHEFKRICDALGGEFVSVFSTSKDRINPLEIVPADPNVSFGNTEEEEALRELMERPLLNSAVNSMNAFCNMVVGDMTPRQKRILNQTLYALYKEWGFTGDNQSAWKDKEKGIVRKSPRLKHLVRKLENVPELEDLYEELLQYTDGTITFFDGDTTVNFD